MDTNKKNSFFNKIVKGLNDLNEEGKQITGIDVKNINYTQLAKKGLKGTKTVVKGTVQVAKNAPKYAAMATNVSTALTVKAYHSVKEEWNKEEPKESEVKSVYDAIIADLD